MMNDRFSAQLRQHLLETANERPADGQLAALVEHVAVTSQQRRLVAWLPGFPVRFGPFPAAVRFGLIAVALLLAALVGAIVGGGGGPRSSTPFEGIWTAIDPGDGSTLTLIVGDGTAPVVRFEDELSTGGACVADKTKVFTADGVGEIAGERLEATFPNGGGCGLETVSVAGIYVYNQDADTLRDQDGVIWTRVPRGDGPPPTHLPTPTPIPTPIPTPEPTGDSGCIDLSQGGTYTAPVANASDQAGPMSMTATIPATPVIPWAGYRDIFHLTALCGDIKPIGFHASTATTVYETSCMPDSLEITSFAEAIARLDIPQGDDISDRIDLTIDGHPAARYDVTNLSTCLQGFGLWNGKALGPLETGSVYVIDVDGVLVSIELNRDGRQTPAELEEAYAIIASLQITP